MLSELPKAKATHSSAMAALSISISSLSPSIPLCSAFNPSLFGAPHVSIRPAVAFSRHLSHRKRRGVAVVTRAGANTSSYVFAVVLPLSLLAVTVFTSIKIADKLDEDFLEDLTINQAIREAEEEDEEEDGDDDDDISLEDIIVQEPVIPRIRNRPKREV